MHTICNVLYADILFYRTSQAGVPLMYVWTHYSEKKKGFQILSNTI